MIHVVAGGEGNFGVGSVDGTGGGEDQVLDLTVTTAFEEVDEACEVAIDVGVGVLDGVADSGLGGEIDDAIEGVALEKLSEGGAIAEIEKLKLKSGLGGELGKAGFF